MKIVVLFMCFCVSLACLPKPEITAKWEQFKRLHRRRFDNLKEENFRKVLFLKSLQEIEEHNERYRRGLETYEVKINQFSDYTDEEIKSYTTGLQSAEIEHEPTVRISKNSTLLPRAAIPESFDWRTMGKVTPVKNQERCGSCWAFAAVGAIESHYAIRYGSTVSLSEQQLVDCEWVSFGCDGGWAEMAYNYIRRNGGINYNESYPYLARDGSCRYSSKNPKITIKGYALIERDEEILKYMVATKGPLSVAIDATGHFRSYSNGVYYNPACSSDTASHAVLVVGYGRENGLDYWLVKNSWGPDWGLGGYIKMARNRNNNCGTATRAAYPIV